MKKTLFAILDSIRFVEASEITCCIMDYLCDNPSRSDAAEAEELAQEYIKNRNILFDN